MEFLASAFICLRQTRVHPRGLGKCLEQLSHSRGLGKCSKNGRDPDQFRAGGSFPRPRQVPGATLHSRGLGKCSGQTHIPECTHPHQFLCFAFLFLPSKAGFRRADSPTFRRQAHDRPMIPQGWRGSVQKWTFYVRPPPARRRPAAGLAPFGILKA